MMRLMSDDDVMLNAWNGHEEIVSSGIEPSPPLGLEPVIHISDALIDIYICTISEWQAFLRQLIIQTVQCTHPVW
jgi:hypothetical protein